MQTKGWAATGGVFVLLLAGCVTAYQPLGATGGYKDERLEKDTYRVSFFGNGNTSRPAVFKYFLYRCAELTLEQGYEYFEIYAAKRDAPRSRAPENEYTQARGATARVPTIVYVPGQTITRWSVTGIVRMYPKDILANASELFSAREVVGLLGSEVRAGNPTNYIPEKLKRIEGKFPVAPSQARDPGPPAAAPGGGPVKLDDLQDLLPK